MKRISQLQPLSKEHHQSLRLAKKCKDIAAKETDEVIKAFSLKLKDDFDTEWDKHFRMEEITIFSVAESKGKEISEVCRQLKTEHQKMAEMVENIAAGDYQLLHEFGQLLYDHTRLEENKLFPMVEEQFSEEELDNILMHS
jgi:hemerythrin-like domain-containing protein